MKNRLGTWLGIWAALALAGGALVALLRVQGLHTGAFAVTIVTVTAALAWLYWGLWCWRQRGWVRIAAGFIVSGTFLIALLALLLSVQQFSWAIAVAGVWAMALTFVLGLWLIRALLAPGWPVLAVARNLIDEAIRMKVALIFVAIMVLAVPMLPSVLDVKERLSYRIQFYLTWSLGITTVMLSVMTVLLACGSICSEQKQRQIYLTLVKPISRGSYLMGKWLGIMLLNLLLVSIAGLGIYTFTRVLQRGPVMADSSLDEQTQRAEVSNQVLVARVGIQPQPLDPGELDRQVMDRIEKIKRENPLTFNEELLREGDRQNIMRQVLAAWLSVPPLGSQTYVFGNLHRPRKMKLPIQFRFKPRLAGYMAPDERVRFAMRINGRPYPSYQGAQIPMVVAVDNYHVLPLPSSLVDDDGRLVIEITNIDLEKPDQRPQGSISFEPGKGMELLYWVDTYEANLVRSMALIWLRLSFLAMLGLVAGTFLGFPVAVLLTALVLVAASLSEFLLESLKFYASVSNLEKMGLRDAIIAVWGDLMKNLGQGKIWDVIKTFIRLIGEAFVRSIPSLSRYSPTPLLSDGRLVSTAILLQGLLWVGMVWTFVLWLVGWLIFRRRELARVIV